MKKLIFLILIFAHIKIFAGIVDTVSVPSEVMQKEYKAVIVFPDKYLANHDEYWPVVYLLHGWSGKYSDWAKKTDLGTLADKYEFIIVCPDGVYAGWYLDSPLIKDSQYETYIAKEVVQYVDENYRIIAKTKGRFICGLSMGGQGAIRLISKYPELFDAAGSMSGVMELSEATKKYGLIQLLGDYESNKDLWQDESCLKIVESLAGKNKGLIIDCGIKDRFIESNRKIHQKMIDLNIQHDYYERPGGHSWDYWVNALDFHLLFFKKRITGKN
ncbi:MAG: esterase family protein [Calditrichia bacterium]|nr:esterase family protein [Calditrichia bacterium]